MADSALDYIKRLPKNMAYLMLSIDKLTGTHYHTWGLRQPDQLSFSVSMDPACKDHYYIGFRGTPEQLENANAFFQYLSQAFSVPTKLAGMTLKEPVVSSEKFGEAAAAPEKLYQMWLDVSPLLADPKTLEEMAKTLASRSSNRKLAGAFVISLPSSFIANDGRERRPKNNWLGWLEIIAGGVGGAEASSRSYHAYRERKVSTGPKIWHDKGFSYLANYLGQQLNEIYTTNPHIHGKDRLIHGKDRLGITTSLDYYNSHNDRSR